jgi:hypothetical protein
MNTCGDCILCCKLMGVAELGKKRMEWCPHVAKGRGCGVYELRPQSCREFQCVWLWSQSNGPTPMPANLKPSVSGVVLDIASDGKSLVAHYNTGVSPTDDTPINRFLSALSKRMAILVKQGRRTMVIKDDEVLAEQMDETDDAPISVVTYEEA